MKEMNLQGVERGDTGLEGAFVIKPKIFSDERGGFVKQFNADLFKALQAGFDIQEAYFSSSKKGVLRGMHFQTPPHEHAKIVYVSSGRALDVIIDLRARSRTFKRFFSTELSASNSQILYIPKGFAHGFLSLEDDTRMHYMQTSVYEPKSDGGILYSSFGFDWDKEALKYGISSFIISARDKGFESLDEFIKKGVF